MKTIAGYAISEIRDQDPPPAHYPPRDPDDTGKPQHVLSSKQQNKLCLSATHTKRKITSVN